jgi:hypothetical protein
MLTFVRLVLSIAAVSVFGWLNYFANAAGTLVSGKAAVHQLDNSDLSYLIATPLTQYAGHFAISGLFLLAVLVLIWWSPVARFIRGSGTTAAAILALLALASLAIPQPAQAFYNKTDYTEAIYVLPNQSAFVIPDVGANKDSQAQFGSKAYYEANKVASKRVLIPHAKLENTGGAWAADYYVPTARVTLVNRTPFNKEWVTATDRGTSNKNDGMPCQSNEGLNITAGVSIGVSVREEGAAKYLYYFGTLPPKGDPADPNVVFASVFYARSVADVMDTIGHGEVLSLVCAEISSRTLVEDNKAAGKIMESIQAKATAYFTERGITLDYIGWADTFDFDKAVQKAINDKFVADTVLPVLPTLQALADVKVKEGLGAGIAAHGLPASLIAIPDSVLGNLSNIFSKPAGK